MPRSPFAFVVTHALCVTACVSSARPPSAAARPILARDAPSAAEGNVEAPPPVPDKKQETASERESRRDGHTWGLVSIGLGATAAVIALGTSALMLEDLHNRNTDCNASKVCATDGLSANTALSQLAPWNTTSWILGAVGLGVGVYLLIANPTDARAGMQVGLAPTGGGLGVNMRSGF